MAFFERSIAAVLGVLTLAVWFLPLLLRRLRALAGIGEAAEAGGQSRHSGAEPALRASGSSATTSIAFGFVAVTVSRHCAAPLCGA